MAINMEDPLEGLDTATTLRVLPQLIADQEESTIRTALSLLGIKENPDATDDERTTVSKQYRAQRYHLEWLKAKKERIDKAVSAA